MAALDVVAFCLYFYFCRRTLPHTVIELLLRLGGSLWLGLLLSRYSRRDQYLLSIIGLDPWTLGWHHLWHGASLYWDVRTRMARSRFGPLIYVGESEFSARRIIEHISRILRPFGATQQPFFDVVRCSSSDVKLIRCCLSEWLFFPVQSAPACAKLRKTGERCMIKQVGTLNPPRVYHFLTSAGPRNRATKSETALLRRMPKRKLLRRRRPFADRRPVEIPNRPARTRNSQKGDLQGIAAALAGHVFLGSKAAALAAWRLSPSSWMYVVWRVDRCEEGWRRRRGMILLRLIASKPRDLRAPIDRILCSIIWPGSDRGRDLIRKSILTLVKAWRGLGYFVPILRHASLRCTWARTRTLGEILSSSSSLDPLLSGSNADDCICERLLHGNPGWSCVSVGGRRHIAATQGSAPWPRHLKSLAKFPASLALPPKRAELVTSFTEALEKLKKRCGVRGDSKLINDAIEVAMRSLDYRLETASDAFPIRWSHVLGARRFLRGLVCKPFDHNHSRLGFFCPALVRLHATKALELASVVDGNFVWDKGMSCEEALQLMVKVPGLTADLQPHRFRATPVSDWGIGAPRLSPKWKAPGMKWRLVIDKSHTPCNRLHSLICRALDVLLDAYPQHLWSDFGSPVDFAVEAQKFNKKARRLFGQPSCSTVAGDMVDCFHHIPAIEILRIWREFEAWWLEQGISTVSVPRQKSGERGRIGKMDIPGWVVVTFDNISCVLTHFADTNFVTVCGRLGQELRGVPMGDALSGAALRLFKWWRERTCSRDETDFVLRYPNTRMQLLRLRQTNVLVLDVSFRDDVRNFAVWSRDAGLSCDDVNSWCERRLRRRYAWGSMELEQSDPDLFIGILTSWSEGRLCTTPDLRDPWGAHAYNVTDRNPLKPWCSWGPSAQKSAAVRGILARCWYFSSSRRLRVTAFWRAFCALILRANFPRDTVARIARTWAKSWTPRATAFFREQQPDPSETEEALFFFDQSSCSLP